MVSLEWWRGVVSESVETSNGKPYLACRGQCKVGNFASHIVHVIIFEVDFFINSTVDIDIWDIIVMVERCSFRIS